METFSALLAIYAGNSPVTGEFPAQRPVTRSFDVFFYLRLNKRLSKQWWCWWFETPSRQLWRHGNVYVTDLGLIVRTIWIHLARGPRNSHDSLALQVSSGCNTTVIKYVICI